MTSPKAGPAAAGAAHQKTAARPMGVRAPEPAFGN